MSGTKIATPQPHTFQTSALSFMSCASARESLPLDENDFHQPAEFKSETKKKRFHPLRNLRRIFRRKSRRSCISADSYQIGSSSEGPNVSEMLQSTLEQRSCSTSRLQDENVNEGYVKNSRLNPGLSLSHDSIFTPDRADSGLSSSDLGNSSPSITVLTPPSRESAIKSQSSCSETSLLSIGSSEMDTSPVRGPRSSDLDLGVTAYKLSHSAAKHKMAVRPRRNYGAPRSRRKTLTGKAPLPTTIEVSEDLATGPNSPAPACISATDAAKPEGMSAAEPADDGEEEASPSQKTESSFFGRLLSRRSEKKKFNLQEASPEERKSDERPVKKAGKSPSRRQRIEPVDIPASPTSRKSSKDERTSPPTAQYWPCQTSSRSLSPPEPSTWPGTGEDKGNGRRRGTEASAPENVLKDLRNPNFVRELTNSVSLFAKDETGKRKKDQVEEEEEQEEEEGEGKEMVPKIRRQHSESETPMKTTIIVADPTEQTAKSSELSFNRNESRVDVWTCGQDVPRTSRPVSTCDPGPEDRQNIQIIELVAKEEMTSAEAMKSSTEEIRDREDSAKLEKPVLFPPEIVTIEPETQAKVASECRESVIVVVESTEAKKVEEPMQPVQMPMGDAEPQQKMVKPAISEKPRNAKRFVGSGFVKVNPKSAQTRNNGGPNSPEKLGGRTATNLVERRKSELLLLTETFEQKGEGKKKEETTPEDVPEVVLRRKSTASLSDEQPELMKVFARRSLKVRESERSAEEGQRSRDSDKENEMVDSPKEERKQMFDGEEKKKEAEAAAEVSAAPHKAEPTNAKNESAAARCGRSLSENNSEGGDGKPAVLEESNVNKMRRRGEGKDEDGSGSGFKRIQQMKAEWERRAQQSAK